AYMARRRFFVENVHRGQAQITGPDAHHLTRVLRVEAGQKLEISDNQNVYLAEVQAARKDLVSFAIIQQLEVAVPCPRLYLLATLIKFEHFEWMLEKATELGVERVTPVETERSEKGLSQAAGKRLARWKRIAREASEQSRRARLPEIGPATPLESALREPATYRYALEEAEARPILSALPVARRHDDQVALLAGPEGGWTERERAMIHAVNWTPVSLGKNILRAETAAIAALAILTAAWDSVS
ncbi:MAG TPA: RsmE family RNA methyltransferase, partial [Bryobacteraceae bacterium]|nr:RsmE family RNA methyltransferase [Bryobacteraceae bacterium]